MACVGVKGDSLLHFSTASDTLERFSGRTGGQKWGAASERPHGREGRADRLGPLGNSRNRLPRSAAMRPRCPLIPFTTCRAIGSLGILGAIVLAGCTRYHPKPI